MKKIRSLFARDAEGVLTREYNTGVEWVFHEGVATRKWDGTAVLVKEGLLYARYDAKRGKEPPTGFIPAQEPDPITGHHPGWILADRPNDKWIREAAYNTIPPELFGDVDWTYEACGPKIGGNPERQELHTLHRHGMDYFEDGPPVTWDGLREFFTRNNIEGVVWWRDLTNVDCDKVKITGAALGVPRSTHRG